MALSETGDKAEDETTEDTITIIEAQKMLRRHCFFTATPKVRPLRYSAILAKMVDT